MTTSRQDLQDKIKAAKAAAQAANDAHKKAVASLTAAREALKTFDSGAR